jgi:hypothetical protein
VRLSSDSKGSGRIFSGHSGLDSFETPLTTRSTSASRPCTVLISRLDLVCPSGLEVHSVAADLNLANCLRVACLQAGVDADTAACARGVQIRTRDKRAGGPLVLQPHLRAVVAALPRTGTFDL